MKFEAWTETLPEQALLGFELREWQDIEILQKVRDRWSVENKNHHPRDATLLEAKCRCRTRNTAANLALLRGATLMLWKKSKPKRTAADFIRSTQRNIGLQ